MSLLLYSGIRNVITLGDTENQVTKRLKLTPTREETQTSATDETLKNLDITHSLYFTEIGTKVYFRAERVVLLEIQEPFRGQIQGKSLKLFAFKPPEGTSWDELLVRQLGPPNARASGGSFGSEGLFYSWGDISFNRMGPNQIALYHDPAIGKYRLTHFGRSLRLFKDK